PDTRLPYWSEYNRTDYFGGEHFVVLQPVSPLPQSSWIGVAQSQCPYCPSPCAQEKGKKIKPASEAIYGRCSPLEYLEKIQWAETAFQLGEFLRGEHHSWLADLCYQAACRLCPGSRIEQLAAQRLDSNRNKRMIELINQSEDLRQIELEWVRIWHCDHPSHLA